MPLDVSFAAPAYWAHYEGVWWSGGTAALILDRGEMELTCQLSHWPMSPVLFEGPRAGLDVSEKGRVLSLPGIEPRLLCCFPARVMRPEREAVFRGEVNACGEP